jgi:predicted dienelactone hydrolase
VGFFRGLFPGAFARQALPFGLSGRVPYPHEIEKSHRMSLNSMRVIRDTRHMSSRTPFMRSIASLLVMLAISPAALADRSQPGPFAVSQRTVTVTRPNNSTFSAQIRYPATSSASSAPFATAAGPAPAVSFGHGFLSAVDLYDSTMDHLASHGYIVIATTSEGGFFPNHGNFALDIRHCLTWLEQQDALKSSWLFDAVNQDAFAVSGHSMGGGAAALAAAADVRIKCLATLAAAETNPSAAAAAGSVQRPARFIVGSQDSIVAPATTQNQYTACDAPRQFVSITGGSHCGFIDSAIIACDSGSISRAEQLAKTRALLLEFFDTHLRGDAADYAVVWGAATPVAGTTTTRDSRTIASLASTSLKGAAGTVLTTTLTVTNVGPDATAIRPRAGTAAFAVLFDPEESAELAAGASAVFTVRVASAAAVTDTATIDAVRVRDGAGTTLSLNATFTAAENPADLDGSGSVDGGDLAILLNAWGACAGCAADIDGNGSVDGADLATLLSSWG